MSLGAVIAVELANQISSFSDKRDQGEKYVTVAIEDSDLGDLFITLDLVETINIRYPTKVSNKPTSKGRKTDNIHNDPVEVTVKGIISNASINVLDRGKTGIGLISLATQVTSLDPYLEGVAAEAAVAALGDSIPKASKEAYDMLKSIRSSKSTVSISTSLEHFKGMIIENIDIPISYDVGDALQVTIRAKAIPFVETGTALVDVTDIDPEKADTTGVNGETDLGSGSSQKQSLLSEGLQKFL